MEKYSPGQRTGYSEYYSLPGQKTGIVEKFSPGQRTGYCKVIRIGKRVQPDGARGEVRFPGDPATMWPVLFKGSRSLLLLACCYVPIGCRMLIYKGGT